ncbi:MAG TPA: WD40 repeat domain-containing protein, partial [Candidatus Acidoferrales bacterium]|nr:WD40 repeat domain-containing protein [Candidatus Acidoferrales bacterium]
MPEAYPAQFTPNSQGIVFYDAGLRVETWSVLEEQRTGVHELVFQKHCLQTALSPDGKTLACYGSQFELALFDVASGATIFQKKSFHEPSFREYFRLLLARLLNEGEASLLNMSFSPDARYFVAAARDENALAFDLRTRAPVPLHGSLKRLLSVNFAFLGPDRVVGVDPAKGENSALLRFPSGEIID